jgi:hypothetical protein
VLVCCKICTACCWASGLVIRLARASCCIARTSRVNACTAGLLAWLACSCATIGVRAVAACCNIDTIAALLLAAWLATFAADEAAPLSVLARPLAEVVDPELPWQRPPDCCDALAVEVVPLDELVLPLCDELPDLLHCLPCCCPVCVAVLVVEPLVVVPAVPVAVPVDVLRVNWRDSADAAADACGPREKPPCPPRACANNVVGTMRTSARGKET